MNSKRKGTAGEIELAKLLCSHGYNAHRNNQRWISGHENPDVSLPGVHIECKRTEALRLYASLEQAVKDANGKKLPAVFHRRNRESWIVIMKLDDWLKLYDIKGETDYGRNKIRLE